MSDDTRAAERGRLLVSRAVPAAAGRSVASPPLADTGGERAGASARRPVAAVALQPQLLVGAVDDPHEREAERTADAVLAGSREEPVVLGGRPAGVFLSPGPDAGPVPHKITSGIHALTAAGGHSLEPSLRGFFEPRFGHDFSAVRTHTGGAAVEAAHALGARAFTVGDHIFFGAGQYRPGTHDGRRLLAHELTHTVQQKPAAARVQRDWLGDPLAAVRRTLDGWAAALPPYELLTVLVGRNPLTGNPVEHTARSFLHAALKLHPAGMAIFAELEKNRSLEKVAQWFDVEIARLNLTWEGVKTLFGRAWDTLGVTDVLNPAAAWEKVKELVSPTLRHLEDFASQVVGKILEFIRTTLLEKLSAWAKEQHGYLLLTFVLGRDPVTAEPVERAPKIFVRAVLDLVDGGDRIYENLEKSKTIERTVTWLNAEITKLDLSWEKIKDLFARAWNAFTVLDLLRPITLIEKIAVIFLPPAKRVIVFAAAAGKKVLEFIFEGAMLLAGPVGEQIVRIVRKVGDTFKQIVADPVRFIGYLVQAVKSGFAQFGKNIWQHLKTGLIEWLVGGLDGAGLALPKVWDLQGIVSIVLQVLGVTYAKLRGKLVKVLGEERVTWLERAFSFVVTLATQGPAAAWQRIVEAIGSLWDLVIGGIKEWAVTKIVTAALVKLVSMLNPAGAVIQAIIATYNTIAFFVERIKQILVLVEAITDSLANIATGKLSQAADFVERAMARAIPVILGFLARLIGLGDVGGAVKRVISGVQKRVDKAIDAVVDWIVGQAKRITGGKGDKGEKPPETGQHDDRWNAAVAGVRADLKEKEHQGLDSGTLEKTLPVWQKKYGFRALHVADTDYGWQIRGDMSPEQAVGDVKFVPFSFTPGSDAGKPTVVEAISVRQSPYEAPYGEPVGWNRLDHNFWVRGHLLHGKSGGPGATRNLVPIPKKVNSAMYLEHEKAFHELVTKHTRPMLWFRAEVGYWSSGGTEDVSEPADFVRFISIEYGEASEKDGKAVKKQPPLVQLSYPVRLPSEAAGTDFSKKEPNMKKKKGKATADAL
ncbi:DUF4157 domain-containing protein [Streptomyces sp. NPDC058320]|uniref:eCIS core domain-containing protein n=1 Tax=unclassified Streptomyces TaxID=2593676 RepID=UPI003628A22B